MDHEEFKKMEAIRLATGGQFQRWKPDGEVGFKLVLDPWGESEYTEWVKAEDAIRREAELLAVIRELEDRAAKSAELLARAIGKLGGDAQHKAG